MSGIERKGRGEIEGVCRRDERVGWEEIDERAEVMYFVICDEVLLSVTQQSSRI